MSIPAEFSGRVVRTGINGITGDLKKINKILEVWQGSEIDVIYENRKSVIVLVFESQEDALAFKLKYGENYV